MRPSHKTVSIESERQEVIRRHEAPRTKREAAVLVLHSHLPVHRGDHAGSRYTAWTPSWTPCSGLIVFAVIFNTPKRPFSPIADS